MSNYCPLSLLSVPRKIVEACVADMIAKHVFSDNEALVTDNQWAYRKGRSTELLLIHLTESWLRAADNKFSCGRRIHRLPEEVWLSFTLNSSSQARVQLWNHGKLTSMAKRLYICTGKVYCKLLMAWPSENTKVAHGTPQGSLLGPIPFALYIGDLPKSVNTATTFLYADDTTMYCVEESVDQVTTTLNKALEELALWCKQNSLVPHAKKCDGMILKRNHVICPLGSLKINQHLIKWSSSSKLLVVTTDNKLTRTKHISELKRGWKPSIVHI